MAVRVEIGGGLRRFTPGYDPARGISLEVDGVSPDQLIAALGIPRAEVAAVMINRTAAKPGQLVMDGDLVGLFQAIMGG